MEENIGQKVAFLLIDLNKMRTVSQLNCKYRYLYCTTGRTVWAVKEEPPMKIGNIVEFQDWGFED